MFSIEVTSSLPLSHFHLGGLNFNFSLCPFAPLQSQTDTHTEKEREREREREGERERGREWEYLIYCYIGSVFVLLNCNAALSVSRDYQ